MSRASHYASTHMDGRAASDNPLTFSMKIELICVLLTKAPFITSYLAPQARTYDNWHLTNLLIA